MTKLIITAKRAGFRRCGIAHPASATEHEDGAFTKEEIEILKAEPNLVVQEVEDKKPVGPKKEAASGAKAKTADSSGSDEGNADGEDDAWRKLPWVERQAHVENITGTSPKSNKEAEELMAAAAEKAAGESEQEE